MAEKPSLDTAYALVKRAGKHISDLKRIYNEMVAAQAEVIVIE
jgi:hypothetical protein